MLIKPEPGPDCPTTFQRFLAVFPARDGEHDAEAAREAWELAIRRASPDRIIAGALAYAHTTDGRERRYIMSPRRWLNEARWRDAAPVSAPVRPAQVWIPYGSREWDAWRRHYLETRNKSPPQDRRGGWRFPSRWPPDNSHETQSSQAKRIRQ